MGAGARSPASMAASFPQAEPILATPTGAIGKAMLLGVWRM